MNKKALIAGAVAAALIAVLVAFLRKSDRRQIEALIGRLERRLERRDAVGFCLYLTDDYHDSAGQSRPGLKDRLAWGLPLLGSLAISVEDLIIEIREKDATTAASRPGAGRAASGSPCVRPTTAGGCVKPSIACPPSSSGTGDRNAGEKKR